MCLERDRVAAEDLGQETLLVQALQSFHRFVPGTNCHAWLVTSLQRVRSIRLHARGRAPVITELNDAKADTNRPRSDWRL